MCADEYTDIFLFIPEKNVGFFNLRFLSVLLHSSFITNLVIF